MRVIKLSILLFLSAGSVAFGLPAFEDCDKDSVFYHAFDKHYNSSFDSALYFIDRAISVSGECDNKIKEVRYLLDKALLLASNGKTAASKNTNKLALKLAITARDSLSIGLAYKVFGNILTDYSQFDSALLMYNSALKFVTLRQDSLELSKIYTRRGICYDDMGVYDKAIENYLSALNICKALNNLKEIGGLYNNLAVVYKKQDDIKSAIIYYDLSREISQKINDVFAIAVTDVNIGLLEKDKGNFAKADSLFQVSLAFFEKNNSAYAIPLVLHNLGELRRKEGKLKEALKYYHRSQEKAKKYNFAKIEAKNNLSLAELYSQKGDKRIALKFALEGLRLSSKQKMLEEARSSNKLLSELYESLGNKSKALAYYKNYHLLEDSIFSEKKSLIINRLKAKFESDQKDAEITLLKNEKALNETQLAASDKQKDFLILLSIAVLAIFGILLAGYISFGKYAKELKDQKAEISRQKRHIEARQSELVSKNKVLMKLSKEKDDLINIVAHDMRSPLNQIKGLLAIIKMESQQDDNKTLNYYFEKIDYSIASLRERINKILDLELINADIINMKLEAVKPSEILENVHALFEGQAAEKGIKITNLCNGFPHSMKVDFNYTIQVMENLVSNAVKFSKSGQDVTLAVSETRSHVRLHVKDHGPGLTAEDKEKLFRKFSRLSAKPTANEKSIGLGLAIVKKYVESMNGEVWCESKKGVGSEFIVQFDKA